MVNNKNLTEIEYYMTKKDRTDWTQAEYDIRDGILRICDVPFEYRSLSLYRGQTPDASYESQEATLTIVLRLADRER